MTADSELNREAVLDRAAQRAADGRTSEAEEILRHALSINPDDALLWSRLGNLYLELENLPEAVGAFRRALQIDPDNPMVLNDLGYALGRTGDTDAAEAACARAGDVVDRALEANPDLVPAALALGEICESRNEPERALDFYHRALTFDPSNTDALLKTAYLEMGRCRFDAALTGFRTYVELRPESEQARLGLCACLQELGRADEALAIYRELLAEDRSRYYSVIKNLLSSGRGMIWLRARELREVLLPEE